MSEKSAQKQIKYKFRQIKRFILDIIKKMFKMVS